MFLYVSLCTMYMQEPMAAYGGLQFSWKELQVAGNLHVGARNWTSIFHKNTEVSNCWAIFPAP